MRCTGLFGPAAVANYLFYDPILHSSAARDSFLVPTRIPPLCSAKSHSRCRAPNPSRRCTDYSHRTKEHRAPRGAGDTTETSLPPSEQSISRDDATSARRPLTTQHTGPRPRRHSFIPKSGPVTTPQMTSPNIYACGTHLLALAEDPFTTTHITTTQNIPHRSYRYHGLP